VEPELTVKMNNAIITKIKPILNCETEIIPWEKVDIAQKNSIERAIIADNSPSYWIIPSNETQLAQVIQCANDNQWSILACGSGSKLNWGGLVKNPQLVVSTAKLNRIIEHAAGDLTVTVEAGVKLADLQNILADYQQFLPVDPAYPELATIGGIIATADAGSWRQRYSSVRDMVLGLTFVRADGKIAKAGGKVVKNVAGYDMMKLFTGSYGTLGVISQVTLRLYPLQEASTTLVLTGNGEAISTATKTMRMSSLTPTRADLLSSAMVNQLGLGTKIGLLLRFQGIPESVQEQGQQVANIAQQLGLQVSYYQDQAEDSLWQQLQKTITIPYKIESVTGKIGIIPNQMLKFISQLNQLTANQGLGMINVGSGLGKIQLNGDNVLLQLSKLRTLLEANQGFLTVLEASKTIKQQFEPWGYNGNALEMMRQIKQKFDPNFLLNPGRFVGKI
jgi:glycolate oxidase FAD binding subunit